MGIESTNNPVCTDKDCGGTEFRHLDCEKHGFECPLEVCVECGADAPGSPACGDAEEPTDDEGNTYEVLAMDGRQEDAEALLASSMDS